MKNSTIKIVRCAAISLAILIGVLCSDGCRTLAAASSAQAQRSTVEVVNADGSEHLRAVSKVAAGDAQQALLQHHLRHMAAQPGPVLIANNDVKLLIDGPQTYDAIFSSLAVAKHTIDVEVYIFDDDHIGRALANLLVKKQRGGVRVRLIYDSVGCIKTPRDLFNEMRNAGIGVVEFNPVNPLAGNPLDLNNRDHRKIVIVDNTIAFTGGINISSVYTHGSGFSRKVKRAPDADKALKDGWRDTQIEIIGPAAQEFSAMFEAVWQDNTDARLLEKKSIGENKGLSATAVRGDKYVRVIGSSPDDKVNLIYSDLLNAIEEAQQSVHITMSYFSPDEKFIEALRRAAQRGVEVELVLPGFSDWWPVLEAGRSHYINLLDAGVVIYERRDVFLHAKTAVIDGVWSTVGSSNMDMRSFLHNNEVNAIVLGNEFGQAMESMFMADRARATNIDVATWRHRSLGLRIQQAIARLFSYWL